MNKSAYKALALLLVFSVMFMPSRMVFAFSDIYGHWAENVIEKWSDSGVINGYEDGSFRPDDNITRAELAKIIATVSKLENENKYTTVFTDINVGDWYYAYVMECYANNIINGYDDGSFRPNSFVTREEAAVMFSRSFDIYAQMSLSFTDSNDISDWALDSVTIMAAQGIIKGYEDGTFRPSEYITRAETVKILDGLLLSQDNIIPSSEPIGSAEPTGSFVTGLGGVYSNGGSGIGPGYGGSGQSFTLTVTFIANGGKFVNNSDKYTVKINPGESLTNYIDIPVCEGSVFSGWYKTKSAADNLDDRQLFDEESAVGSSVILYAGWYSDGPATVTFNTNNGTPLIPAIEVENGDYVMAPVVALERPHYSFKGWFRDAAATEIFDFENTAIKKDIIIYAGWKIDSEYADKEIEIPNRTDNYISGSIIAAPTTLLPGEKTYITIEPPHGYKLPDNSKIIVKYLIATETGPDEEQLQTFVSKNNSFVFEIPENIKLGSIKIQPDFTTQIGPTPTPEPTKDPNATPTPTPEPTKPPIIPGEEKIIWECSSADDSKKKGEEVAPGLSLMFDVSSKGSANVTIDGNNFKHYISSGENGSWGGSEASGTALKYVASEDGEFTVYVTKMGNEKTLYITKSGVSNKEEKDGENVIKFNDTGENLDLSLSIIVEKGQTYFAYVSGSKGRFIGAGFAPALGGNPSETTKPSTPTSAPTQTPQPMESKEIDMTKIDQGTPVSKSEDGYTEVRQRSNGEILYCPSIGEEPEIELPDLTGYGDKESYYVFRNQTDAGHYKYTANIPDLLARTPYKTDSEDTMVGVLRVKSPCNGTLKLIYARNGSDSSPGYSLFAYNGINGEQQVVSALSLGGIYYETKIIDVKTEDVIYFDSDWEKGIKCSYAIFTPSGDIAPTPTKGPESTQTPPPIPTMAPDTTPIPTENPNNSTKPPVTGDEVFWTFGDGTDMEIEAGTLDLGNGLSYITTDSKSAYASGGKVGELEFPGRIKLGGKSTFDEAKPARVFMFTPSSSGTVTIYFAHGSSKDLNPRNAIVYQNGKELTQLPVNTSDSTSGSCEVSGGSPVYIGGGDNIGIFGIKFTASK